MIRPLANRGTQPPSLETRRAWWTRQFLLWHRLTGAASLAVLVFFALTGFLLNHPSWIPARTQTQVAQFTLPEPVREALAETPASDPLPRLAANWLGRKAGYTLAGLPVDHLDGEIWIDLPRPGGDGLMIIDLASGGVELEISRKGWIATAADLHKGRDSGALWGLVIDLFALTTLIFALSGLGLLVQHARARPATWPVTFGGLALPLLVFLLFIHV